ncbi:hypothetical protein OKA04_12290 [Luteolibacter flavescens]|uniref:Tetratricopeptide repeat protein n=1 Tax=Luteolibacter flavescens TaxID=1859460 RepID=A0ABT3FPK9_9BACT|nr:hypothetical protein [Luteolibacter flavescens]MCW1885510.1 hypothetical protein [Luteolibacter flavescens]
MSIEAAEGYIELGLFHDAWDALEDLEPAQKTMPAVIRLRLQCALGFERWMMVETLADLLAQGEESDREGAARAYHLLVVVSLRVKRIETAKRFVAKAVEAWPAIRSEIIDDPDLSELF